MFHLRIPQEQRPSTRARNNSPPRIHPTDACLFLSAVEANTGHTNESTRSCVCGDSVARRGL